MLSDRTIKKQMAKGHLRIEPPDGKPLRDWQIQPVSVDLRLGGVSLRNGTPLPASVDAMPFSDTARYGPGNPQPKGWVIRPHQFLLGSTWEAVGVCENIVGTVEGKSTIAREGLMIESAGLVDPNFHGELTLELFNMSDEPIRLLFGQPICQVCFQWTDTTPERKYGEADNHYQGQRGPTPSWRLEL